MPHRVKQPLSEGATDGSMMPHGNYLGIPGPYEKVFGDCLSMLTKDTYVTLSKLVVLRSKGLRLK